MPSIPDTVSDYERDTLSYLDELDRYAVRAIDMVGHMPLPPVPLRELQQTWRTTRDKLAYFKRAILRAEGESREELSVLHLTLLPSMVDYQVRIGAVVIGKNCQDGIYLNWWTDLWNTFSAYSN